MAFRLILLAPPRLPLFPRWLALAALLFGGGAVAADFPDRFALVDLFRQGEFTRLERTLERYQQGVENGSVDERVLAFAVESVTDGNPDSASLFNEWVKAKPRHYLPYLLRAHYYYNTAWAWRGHDDVLGISDRHFGNMYGYLKLAADDLTTAINLRPSLSIAYALSLRVLMLAGAQEMRGEAYREAIEQHPHSYLVRASYLWSLKPEWGGSLDRALRYVREVATLTAANPRLADLLGYVDYILAESLAVGSQYEQAGRYYDLAIERGADHHVYRQRGINHYRSGRYAPALRDFNAALKLWPQSHRVLRWRANVYLRQERFQEALDDLLVAVELSPYDKPALLSLALALRKLGRFQGVAELYDRALYYDALDAAVWFEKGMHYSRDLFQFEAAAENLQRATELAPDETQYWYQYAASLHYALDCGISAPLRKYLELCAERGDCNQKELQWGRDAEVWLEQSGICENP